MGVPKFFRWCAERYPNITRNLGNYAPPMDNLYLDVNGIIHNCTHPNDVDVLKRAPTQREMIHAIFIYLERLFNAVQPRKHFMVAVDGVAPRAKMNQQRQRRYRAGYEMMIAREEALDRGEEVPEETAVFDSNCITPGTPFMVLVSEKIQYFLAMKVATDPAWQKCKIIYSGHDCPGEGEHKIVEFIRRRKMEPGYSPNETHCMYGLDADLVMLAITTHEPRFVLLREEVTFGNNNANNNKDNKNGGGRAGGSRSEIWKEDPRLMTNHTFVLLDIGLLRDYLALEITEICLANDVKPNHDLERFLDDFVFTCFFIGNDFLPSIPTVGINDDSIIQMLNFYVREVRRKDGYLTHHGKIQWQFVEMWLNALGKTELEVIRKRQQEEEQYQKRRARIDPSHEAKSSLEKTFETIAEYKQHFYMTKHKMAMGYQPTSEEMRALRRHYIEGLTWVMEYYYQGPPSWKWFFPHYYAPMASDLIGLVALAQGVAFEDSSPFLPHQQLLAVLPPMSYRCLPPAYWPLLKNPNSPLASVFPDHIEIDREGTRASWEGIVLIPFMEEEQLLAAYESVQAELTEEDRRHNKLGPALEIFHDTNTTVDVLDDMFPALRGIHVCRRPFTLPPPQKFVPVLCGGFDPKRVMEGFGALVSPHALKVSYGREAVKVFDMPSRRESLLLHFACSTEMNDVEKLKEYLGQEVLVGYPYWRRARLEMLENESSKTFRN